MDFGLKRWLNLTKQPEQSQATQKSSHFESCGGRGAVMNKGTSTLALGFFSLAASLFCADASAQQSVNLSALDNRYGIARPGTSVTGGGMDGYGYAYAANLLGASLSFSGQTFVFGAPGPHSAVTSKVIPLPAGKDASLSFLATGVDGNQTNQTFVVTYTDGSKTSFTRSLSDWHTPQHYPGESIALTTAYRITATGGKQAGTFDVYGYTLRLNATKTVRSLTVPTNPHVVLLAIDIKTAPTAATPSFSPPPGIYAPYIFGKWTPQAVTLGDTTPGATIYYSIDEPYFFTPSPGSFPNLRYGGSPLPLKAGSETRVNAQAAADGFDYSVIGRALYHIPVFPSENFTGGDIYLFNAHQNDSCTPQQLSGNTCPVPTNSCAYYRAIGADTSLPPADCPTGTNPDGSVYFSSGITKDHWLANVYNPILGLGAENSAMFVNMSDLNLTRDHHAVMKQDPFTQQVSSAAYVCNYPGPDFYHSAAAHGVGAVDQAAVDAAIRHAKHGANPLPCVAIDYGIVPGVNNGQAVMRFLVFDQWGHLLPRVDLDSRGAKEIPDACSACHGVPFGATAGGVQQMNFGRYIPFDEGNLLFSSAQNLNPVDREARIKSLNMIVLNGEGLTAGDPLNELINGLYAYCAASPTPPGCVSPSMQFPYVPAAFYTAPATIDDEVAYFIYGSFCRSCHVANGVFGPPADPNSLRSRLNTPGYKVCDPKNATSAIMPNAKVTFDRLWTTHFLPSGSPGSDTDIPSFLARYLGITCDFSYQPYPNE